MEGAQMPRKLDVSCDGVYAYSIYIERSFDKLPEALRTLSVSGRRVLIVTDTNVAPLYLDEVKEHCKTCFEYVDSLVLTPGEEHKNTDSISEIYERLILDGFDRNDYLLALGGGVTGDMTGFAAATYMRGIAFIQVPTTLLAQVDSSIGGKTGVDFRAYKNMVGAFHMPKLVYSCIGTLASLDKAQYASGMGEVIKHSMIKVINGVDYYHYLLTHKKELETRDPDVLEETVYYSNLIKRDVVERDPKEHGERKILNFGHTLGHAIEKCSHFSYTHGQCVAFGCLGALHLSHITTEEENNEIRSLMESVGLDTKLKEMNASEILAATRKDKKMDHGHVSFILLHDIGQAYIDTHVTDQDMASALQYLMQTGKILNNEA